MSGYYQTVHVANVGSARNNNISGLNLLSLIYAIPFVYIAVAAVAAVAIGIVAFIGIAAFTSVASVVIPSVVKIATWSMAESELLTCIFLSAESLLVGAVIGFIKGLFHRKRNNFISSSLKNDKSIISSVISNATIGMSIGSFIGVSGVKGIIQSTIFNASLNPQTIIGTIIFSGGAGGIAGGGGILSFLFLFLILIIQGAIIGLIVGAILGSFSNLLTSAVRHGIIETNIFLLNNKKDKNCNEFAKFIIEGIVIGCLLGFLNGIIIGKEAVENHESFSSTSVIIVEPANKTTNNVFNTKPNNHLVSGININDDVSLDKYILKQYNNYNEIIKSNSEKLVIANFPGRLSLVTEIHRVDNYEQPRLEIDRDRIFGNKLKRPVLYFNSSVVTARERPDTIRERLDVPELSRFNKNYDTINIHKIKGRLLFNYHINPNLIIRNNLLDITERSIRQKYERIEYVNLGTENSNEIDYTALPIEVEVMVEIFEELNIIEGEGEEIVTETEIVPDNL